MNARIDRADAERKPLPKPDIRSMLRPLGPVVVFRSQQFSVGIFRRWRRHRIGAGRGKSRDREGASGSSWNQRARRARDSKKAFANAGLPEGVFSLLFDAGTRVGTELVQASAGQRRRIHRIDAPLDEP